MLYYRRTDVSDGFDVSKTSAWKGSDVSLTTGIFKVIVLSFNQMSATDVMTH